MQGTSSCLNAAQLVTLRYYTLVGFLQEITQNHLQDECISLYSPIHRGPVSVKPLDSQSGNLAKSLETITNIYVRLGKRPLLRCLL